MKTIKAEITLSLFLYNFKSITINKLLLRLSNQINLKRMNKLIIVLLGIAPILCSAQDIKSKKGENYLPEAKDWAIQIDAVPFLNYTGRLLSNGGSTSPNIASNNLSPLTIGGKYFLTNNYAYRAKIRIGLTSNTLKNTIIDNAKTNTDTIFTSDSKTFKSTNITLSF